MKWIFAALVVAGLLAWYLGMNYVGFCHSQVRFLSDREKIEVGVAYLLKIYPPSINFYENRNGERVLVDNRSPSNAIPYDGLEDFFARNPDCCQFSLTDRQNDQPPTLNRLLGDVSGFANVTFLVRYRDANGQEIAAPIRLDPGVSNCGKIWFD
jgi:hypothetical protein